MKEVMDTLPYIAFINVLLAVLALLTKDSARAFFKVLTLTLFIAMIIIAVGYFFPKDGSSPLNF